MHVYSYGMLKLFFLTQAVLATISICGVFLTIIPVQDADGQQQQQQQLLPIDAIFKQVENSTVGIITESNNGSNLEFDGTGFVYDIRGDMLYIVTNAHVVEGFDEVDVSFKDGSIHTAQVKGIDPQGDIAVLEIIWDVTSQQEQQQQQPPTPLAIGNLTELQVGEQVIAIGNSFLSDQSFANLLTTGVISKLGVEALLIEDFDTESILNAIVTDAAITEGNSGGPLLNLKGEVIGMNTAADDDTPCCTYAIPSNTIKHIVPTLIETGEYIHPWLGLAPLTLNEYPQSSESISSNIQGVIVSYIDRDGPAHKAGLNGSTTNQFDEIELRGDIITAIDGEPVATADEFNAYIDEHKIVGDNVVLSIYRNNGQTTNFGVTLEENPYYSSNTE
jgi:S1-C subfamily serine protease